MRTERTVPYRLTLLARGFRSVLVVYESVSTAVGPGSQPATHVGRASLLVPRSGQGVNPDARLLVRKKTPGVTADTKVDQKMGRAQVDQVLSSSWDSELLRAAGGCELLRAAEKAGSC